MKEYKFFIVFEPVIIFASDIRSALSQLKKEVGLEFYNISKTYVVNNQVRSFKEDFISSVRQTRDKIHGIF